MPLQPQTYTGTVDLSKPIKLTPAQGGKERLQVGDIYFDGIRWQRVAAVVPGTSTFAAQDCTDAVRAVGRVYAPPMGETGPAAVAWSVAAWELYRRLPEDAPLWR